MALSYPPRLLGWIVCYCAWWTEWMVEWDLLEWFMLDWSWLSLDQLCKCCTQDVKDMPDVEIWLSILPLSLKWRILFKMIAFDIIQGWWINLNNKLCSPCMYMYLYINNEKSLTCDHRIHWIPFDFPIVNFTLNYSIKEINFRQVAWVSRCFYWNFDNGLIWKE